LKRGKIPQNDEAETHPKSVRRRLPKTQRNAPKMAGQRDLEVSKDTPK